MKVCNKCKTNKDDKEFSKCARNNDGLAWMCKECDRIRAKERYRKVGRDPDYDKDIYLKRLYGISLTVYNEMLAKQDGKCAICSRECTTGRSLAVDHCHSTGKIRGLLCQGCNTSIGRLYSVELLKSAIKYLEVNLV